MIACICGGIGEAAVMIVWIMSAIGGSAVLTNWYNRYKCRKHNCHHNCDKR